MHPPCDAFTQTCPLKQILLSGLIACCTLLAGCHSEELDVKLPPFDGPRAFAETAALVQFSPRDGGTPNAKAAAQHIAERLTTFGIATETDTFQDQTPEGEKTFHNVVGRIPGTTDQWIVLASHFDTMPGIENFQGANDSGSSTGILLELARMLAGRQANVGILFAFFDGEEGIREYIPGDGLHGSRHLAEKMRTTGELSKIQAFILLDMVGDPDLNITIPYNSSRTLVKHLLDSAHDTDHRKLFSLSNYIITDDHSPFLDMNVPAIDIIDFQFGSAPGKNDYWHTPSDDLEHISAKSMSITGDIVLNLLTRLIHKH